MSNIRNSLCSQLKRNFLIKTHKFISRGYNINPSCRVQGDYQDVRSIGRNSSMRESDMREQGGCSGDRKLYNFYFTPNS